MQAEIDLNIIRSLFGKSIFRLSLSTKHKLDFNTKASINILYTHFFVERDNCIIYLMICQIYFSFFQYSVFNALIQTKKLFTPHAPIYPVPRNGQIGINGH